MRERPTLEVAAVANTHPLALAVVVVASTLQVVATDHLAVVPLAAAAAAPLVEEVEATTLAPHFPTKSFGLLNQMHPCSRN